MALRIQRSHDGEEVTLTVCGRLTDGYVAELERVVEAEGVEPRLVLNLKEVTHVTRDGVRLLARLEISGARILGCPEYLREWISRERDYLSAA